MDIYVVKNYPDSSLIKIGFTSDLTERARFYRTHNPESVFIKIIHGAIRSDESFFHNIPEVKASRYHISEDLKTDFCSSDTREWYYDNNEVRKAINTLEGVINNRLKEEAIKILEKQEEINTEASENNK